MNGVIVVDKPAGCTSHDVVAKIRRVYGTKRVGHTGTLDPMATGVLVICLGHATRIVEYLTATRKEYSAGVAFGLTTDTEDSSGRELSEVDASGVTRDAIELALDRFRGSILQSPPMVSAVHHDGKRLYELARQGIEVERTPRRVEIHRIELTGFKPGVRAEAALDVVCSTGTYIRTLAADIGKALGVGGIMTSLVRTRVGPFALADAHSLESLAALKDSGELESSLIPIADALPDWPRVSLTSEEAGLIRNGRAIPSTGPDGPLLLTDETDRPVGIAARKDGVVAPTKVFPLESRV